MVYLVTEDRMSEFRPREHKPSDDVRIRSIHPVLNRVMPAKFIKERERDYDVIFDGETKITRVKIEDCEWA